MAKTGTIVIGERTLRVREETLGFERRMLKPWRQRNREALDRLTSIKTESTKADGTPLSAEEVASVGAAIEKASDDLTSIWVDGLLMYFEGNEPAVTAEWLEDFIPTDPEARNDLLRDVLKAAGRKLNLPPAGAPPGEAKGQ